jgi:hypothetical protein
MLCVIYIKISKAQKTVFHQATAGVPKTPAVYLRSNGAAMTVTEEGRITAPLLTDGV